MDKSWRYYAKGNQPVTKGQILYDSTCTGVPRGVKFIEVECRMVVARGGEKGATGSCLTGYRVLVLRGENCSEYGWWLQNNVAVPLNCRLNIITMVTFMLYIIYHNKKCILSERRHQQNNTCDIILFVWSANWFIVTKSMSVVAWGWSRGRIRPQRGSRSLWG